MGMPPRNERPVDLDSRTAASFQILDRAMEVGRRLWRLSSVWAEHPLAKYHGGVSTRENTFGCQCARDSEAVAAILHYSPPSTAPCLFHRGGAKAGSGCVSTGSGLAWVMRMA